MKSKNYANLLFTILFVFALSACNSKEPAKQVVDTNNISTHSQAEQEKEKNKEQDKEKDKPSQAEKDFQFEIDGLSKLENNVKKGNFESSAKLFDQLHEIYHPSVLPLVENNNPDLAEEMHNKFDALEDAINRKDKTQTIHMVHTNRQYLLKAGEELGLSLK